MLGIDVIEWYCFFWFLFLVLYDGSVLDINLVCLLLWIFILWILCGLIWIWFGLIKWIGCLVMLVVNDEFFGCFVFWEFIKVIGWLWMEWEVVGIYIGW